MSRDKLLTGLNRMMQILQSSDQNTTGQSQSASGSGTVIEKPKLLELILLPEGQSQTASGSGAIIEKSKLLELISLVEEMLGVARTLPSTNQQAKTQRTFRWSSIASILPFPSFPSSPKKVQVYSAVDTPEGVDTALMKYCKDMYYKWEFSKHINDLQHDVPLLLVCPVTSRLEPDIDHALNGLNWQSCFIALVLHQGNEYSIPRVPTATKLPDKTKYVQAKFVDMAYSLELYACKMNEDATQKILEFYACKMNEDAKQTIKEFIDKF